MARRGASARMSGGVILVAGPPCSGKSTLVAEHAAPGDLILDIDELRGALTGEPAHAAYDQARLEQIRPFVWAAFYAVLAEHRRRRSPLRLWVIQGAPRREQRDEYRRMNHAHVVVLETPLDVCLTRCAARDGATRPEWIHEWFALYEPHPADQVIRAAVAAAR